MHPPINVLDFSAMTSTSSASADRFFIPRPAGQIYVIQDLPVGQMAGIAVVIHPHPLLVGKAKHKVPQLIARACQAHGYLAVRPNFRGVGGTTGTHDASRGETEDVLVVARHFCQIRPGMPLILAGFSFGAFVQTLVGTRMADNDEVHARMILVGTPSGPISGGGEYFTRPFRKTRWSSTGNTTTSPHFNPCSIGLVHKACRSSLCQGPIAFLPALSRRSDEY